MITTPQVIIIAGPNGSGKSTLIRQLRSDNSINFPEHYINADDIAVHLRETLPDLSQEAQEEAAFYRARNLRAEYRNNDVSHAFETVLSHPSTLMDMHALRKAGFQISLHFVTTERPEINIERVKHRVREGGHDVSVERIRNRYHRVMHLMPCAVEIADYSYIYDSSNPDSRTHFPVTRLVAAFKRGEIQASDSIPEFLTQKLLTPLGERLKAKFQIKKSLPIGSEIVSADEVFGVYSGIIQYLSPHYCLHKISSTIFVQHDVRLLTALVCQGDNVIIKYKDGYGTPQANTPI